jgi:uncharacterized SAM-binding protein YcdF (DUF218 family)
MMGFLDWVLQPDSLLLLGLIVVAVFLACGWLVYGRRLLYCLVTGALFISIAPVGEWLTSPLENRFSRPSALTSDIQGLLVLAGGEDMRVSASRGVAALGPAAERIVEAALLARAYPELPILYSGGRRRRAGERTRNADPENTSLTARMIFNGLGVDSSRITYETESRTTAESALLAQGSVSNKNGWLLVTSAWHMPRAIGVFRAEGWGVVAFPVDYETRLTTQNWGRLNFKIAAQKISIAIHEWGGLVWYRLSGRSDAWFPAP